MKIDKMPTSCDIKGVSIPKDPLWLILLHTPSKFWPQLKRVCKAFYRILTELENRYPVYNYVDYNAQHYDRTNIDKQQASRSPAYPRFRISTSKILTAMRQIGSTPLEEWAPLLTCDQNNRLNLYHLDPRSRRAVRVCSYRELEGKRSDGRAMVLSAAVSLGDNIVTAYDTGVVAVWSPPKPNRLTTILGKPLATTVQLYREQTDIQTVEVLNCYEFVSGDYHGVIKFWDIRCESSKKTIEATDPVMDIRKISNNTLLVLQGYKQPLTLTIYINDVPITLLSCQRINAPDFFYFPFGLMRILSPTQYVSLDKYFYPGPDGLLIERNIGVFDCNHSDEVPQHRSIPGPEKAVRGQSCNFFSRANFYCYAERQDSLRSKIQQPGREKKMTSYVVNFCKTPSELRLLEPDIEPLLEKKQHSMGGATLR